MSIQSQTGVEARTCPLLFHSFAPCLVYTSYMDEKIHWKGFWVQWSHTYVRTVKCRRPFSFTVLRTHPLINKYVHLPQLCGRLGSSYGLVFPSCGFEVIGNSFKLYMLPERYVGNTTQPPKVILDMQWSITEYTIKVKNKTKQNPQKALKQSFAPWSSMSCETVHNCSKESAYLVWKSLREN